jgi:hypothetical protein
MRISVLPLALLLAAWAEPSQAFMPSNRILAVVASSQTAKIVPTRWARQKVVVCSFESSSSSTTDEKVVEKKKVNEEKLFSDPSDLPGQGFENDGPLAWLQMYLEMFGLKEGKSIAYGPIPVNIDESKRPSSDVAKKMRNDAADNLQNIGMDERQRRDNAANVMAVVTAVYATWVALFADHGGFDGHVLRFLTVIPLFLAYGYKLSAQTGL